MGTRSLTVFHDGNEEIAVLYRQFDGYPGGHGQALASFLAHKRLTNGFGSGDNSSLFNGMGCLTALVVAHFKIECGHFYLYPAGTRGAGEEYIYHVRGEVPEEPTIEVFGYGDELFSGSASEALEWITAQDA